MSLGRHSGATLVGRPLDVSVQAVLEAQEDASVRCLEAEVFYGDTKLANSRVNVTIERSAAAPAQALIRIRSSLPVDEPIVTFYLRVGCQIKTERRYVVLAELASEAVADKNAPLSISSVPPSRAAATQPFNAAGPIGQAAAPNTAGVARRMRSVAPADSVPGAKPRGLASPAQSRGATKSAQARLKLEPVDLAIDRDPRLKSSTELLSIPAVDMRERVAASALWRALSAQPEDILRDSERLKTLENSVAGLQTQNQKGLLSIDELNAKVKQAEQERYDNVFVYALIGLLLAALLGLIFLLRRRSVDAPGESVDKPWWRKNDGYENQESQQQAWSNSLAPTQLDGLGVSRPGSLPKSRPVDIEVNFDIEPATSISSSARPAASSMFLEQDDPACKFPPDFEVSAHPSRTAKAEELFDVQQQADFFVSIGQHDQAIEVLQSHIAENQDTSALVHLDLINLYHKLQLPEQYDKLRETFNLRFNAQVPAFELYTDENLGLESYKLALSRIEALWPTARVLDVIEESLFRRPDNQAEAFNLEAYRELLLLYSIAKDIIKPQPVAAVLDRTFDLPDRDVDGFESAPMNFKATSIQPLSAIQDLNQTNRKNLSAEPLAATLLPPFSLGLGLDIDLGELSPAAGSPVAAAALDQELFAKLDLDITSPPPDVGSTPTRLPEKGATDGVGSIDFDIFDMPDFAPVKPKLPRT